MNNSRSDSSHFLHFFDDFSPLEMPSLALSNDLFSFFLLSSIVLGFIGLILNIFVISVLVRHRKRIFVNVFYVIVLHSAMVSISQTLTSVICRFFNVDLLRGSCLIVWGMPHLVQDDEPTVGGRILILKLKQVALLFLRSSNLLTIFNLLVFTINEFLVVCHPLHYRHYFRRRIVYLIILTIWSVSVGFGVGSFLVTCDEAPDSVLIRVRNSNQSKPVDNSLAFTVMNDDNEMVIVRRRELTASVAISKLAFLLLLFTLCYICLMIVLVCYSIVLRTVQQFQSLDGRAFGHRANRQASQSDDRGSKSHQRLSQLFLLSRKKYIIVIGTVLFVDVLFLFPYSAIQIIAFLHLNDLLPVTVNSALLRWSLGILIGFHSVCQPLCYFRMAEFRRLACDRQRNSKSFENCHRTIVAKHVSDESRNDCMPAKLLSTNYPLTRRRTSPNRHDSRDSNRPVVARKLSDFTGLECTLPLSELRQITYVM